MIFISLSLPSLLFAFVRLSTHYCKALSLVHGKYLKEILRKAGLDIHKINKITELLQNIKVQSNLLFQFSSENLHLEHKD